MPTYFEALNELAASNVPFVSVTVVDTMGSTPQDRGSKMLVTREGRYFGTTGGGRIEVRCIDEAKNLLDDAEAPKTRYFQWSLEKDIGMTCGGIVRVYFEAFNVTRWNVVVFGAGHVAQSVVEILTKLDCRITCIDPREDWLSRMVESPRLTKVCTSDMPGEVKKIPGNAFVVLMTMGRNPPHPEISLPRRHRQSLQSETPAAGCCRRRIAGGCAARVLLSDRIGDRVGCAAGDRRQRRRAASAGERSCSRFEERNRVTFPGSSA